jgi:hypothetical protein
LLVKNTKKGDSISDYFEKALPYPH